MFRLFVSTIIIICFIISCKKKIEPVKNTLPIGVIGFVGAIDNTPVEAILGKDNWTFESQYQGSVSTFYRQMKDTISYYSFHYVLYEPITFYKNCDSLHNVMKKALTIGQKKIYVPQKTMGLAITIGKSRAVNYFSPIDISTTSFVTQESSLVSLVNIIEKDIQSTDKTVKSECAGKKYFLVDYDIDVNIYSEYTRKTSRLKGKLRTIHSPCCDQFANN